MWHEPMSMVLPPTRKQLVQGVQFILTAPKPVYVHCHDGVDRTGCMLAAYAVLVQKRPSREVVKHMLDEGFHTYRYFWWLPFLLEALEKPLPLRRVV